ncbi:hypothetical protein Mapa_002075 [Marchantia paleacea]|nr:hypothetical protein Mapa_002075 [Marchantia paleacea]
MRSAILPPAMPPSAAINASFKALENENFVTLALLSPSMLRPPWSGSSLQPPAAINRFLQFTKSILGLSSPFPAVNRSLLLTAFIESDGNLLEPLFHSPTSSLLLELDPISSESSPEYQSFSSMRCSSEMAHLTAP